MKILFSLQRLYPPTGGGDRSALTLFEELAKEHNVEVICCGRKNEIIEYKGIKIYHVKSFWTRIPGWVRRYFLNKLWVSILDYFLKGRKYNLMVTQAELTPASVMMAKKYHIPVLTFVRGFEHFCLSRFHDVYTSKKHNCLKYATWKYKIQYLFFKRIIKEYEKSLRNSDYILANSKFKQMIIKEWYDLNSVVIYPFVRFSDYRIDKRNPKFITLVRPKIWKGVDIFLKIADSMPDKNFLAVGDTDRLKELKKSKNVKYIPWTEDMKKIYSMTKILLAPAIMHDSAPRIIFEAMSNGIPCIVSNMGGQPECVDDAGIVIKNTFDINAWVNVINRLETDKKFYKKLSRKSKTQVKKFEYKKQVKKFKKLLKISYNN